MYRISALLLCVCAATLTANAQVDGYYRMPDIHGDRIVFNAEGDLWTAPASGGAARRITTHLGEEAWPVISPDGLHIAFTASYDGTTDAYVIPAEGGKPRRISWDGSRPVGWTRDGRVMLRTSKYAGLPDARLVLVDPENGSLSQVPLSQAAEGSMADDSTLFFARLPRQGSNSRWYKGGLAQKLWKFKDGDPEATPLTIDYPGTSRQPNVMNDGRVYFLSDREGGMNIWSMNQAGGDLQRHTTYEAWDIQELAGDGATLVYRLGADLYTMDVGSGTTQKVPVTLVTDSEQALIDWEDKPMQYLSDAALRSDGKRVAFVSRGELFTVPVGEGRTAHVSRNSGVRYRNVMFGKDSSEVIALSDRSGELEWWRTPVDGIGAPVQITNGPAMLRRDGVASPDGRYLSHTDYDDQLWLVDMENGTSKKIAEAPAGNGAWSPDSRYLVYSRYMPALMTALFVYDVKEDQSRQLTSDRFMDGYPAFSADGNWLYFLSSRTWNSTVSSPWGERAPQPHFEKQDKMYAIPLREGVAFPNAVPNELTEARAAKKEDKEDDEKKEDEKGQNDGEDAKPMRWDLTHLLREVPVPAGDYSGLSANDKRIFYISDGDLMALDLKAEAEPVRLVEKTSGYELAGGGKHILLRKQSKMHVIPASAGKDVKLDDKNEVDVGDLRFAVDKRAEWTQIYNDAWRMHRDYFWDPAMHGVDWEAMRDKYAALLPRVGSREELSDLQGMLVSELSLLHSNAGGGDTRREELTVTTASLGGVFERDAETGGFRLVHRYDADPDLPEYWSPLAHPDVQIAEGSVILSVNGQPASSASHISELLQDQAGKQVRLAVQDSGGTNRDVVITPISSRQDFNVRYHEWEYARRKRVDELSSGTVGYVHLRAMGRNDIGQWTREFYSQTRKQGLIVDVRHNNGGNIDSWVLSQLLRRHWSYFKPRKGEIFPNMQYSFNGHLVVLVDERTASDGEAFADGFRRLGLGKAIGVRTWGGEVWLSSSNRQVDGGVARASELGVYGPERAWLIEGWGFVPDMEVDNLPHETFNGRDAQLEAAVQYLEDLIEEDPRLIPEPPPYPVLVPGSGFPTPWHEDVLAPSGEETTSSEGP